MPDPLFFFASLLEIQSGGVFIILVKADWFGSFFTLSLSFKVYVLFVWLYIFAFLFGCVGVCCLLRMHVATWALVWMLPGWRKVGVMGLGVYNWSQKYSTVLINVKVFDMKTKLGKRQKKSLSDNTYLNTQHQKQLKTHESVLHFCSNMVCGVASVSCFKKKTSLVCKSKIQICLMSQLTSHFS